MRSRRLDSGYADAEAFDGDETHVIGPTVDTVRERASILEPAITNDAVARLGSRGRAKVRRGPFDRGVVERF